MRAYSAASRHRGRAPWTWSDELASRLAQAGTKLAVFNACNSGFWPFVRPLVRAGVPAVVGVQGLVSNLAALNFAEKLYRSLAVGLSLDEALTYARLYVIEPERSSYDCDWGRFMTYMPTESAVLFPRSEEPIRRRQQAMRNARAHTIAGLAERLDGEGVSRMLSDIASRSVLILGRFTAKRKVILDAIRTALATPPRDTCRSSSISRSPAIDDLHRVDCSPRIGVSIRDCRSLTSQERTRRATSDSAAIPVAARGADHRGVATRVSGRGHILRRPSVKPVVHYRDEAHLMTILDAQILTPAEKLYAELNPRAFARVEV